jgi:hypothetical protein
MRDMLLFGVGDLGRSFERYSDRSSSLSANWFLIVVALVIVGLWVGLYYWDRHRGALTSQAGRRENLFQQLCRAHRLTRQEHSLLTQIVKAKQVAEPAHLFVDPDLLNAPVMVSDLDVQGYADLKIKIFGTDE